ncbi:hypothetical protein DM01DRAFT_1172622 [Hesseltinella vesiculosa]|uniref:N-acetyltransferase domain-containing protein n=1 Tax=Hesseltinella vesiculosa TaxID=101127 RepID=A0A1X2G5G6_9FUNG|nr:hypothetical protein DM01DRAFT_1172622 [Hesseltinella vesiculosa]
MDPSFTIRSVKDVEEASYYFREWPVLAGWNHSCDDEEVRQVFYPVDSKGMLLGTVKDDRGKETVVGSVFACKHTDQVGFIGCFIVPEVHRCKGYGSALFTEALRYLGECQHIGLDGKYEMVDTYVRSGFKPSNVGLTYRGDILQHVVKPLADFTTKMGNSMVKADLAPLTSEHLKGLVELDLKHAGMERWAYWQQWIHLHTNDQSKGRAGWVVLDNDKNVTHFGTVRPAVRGFVVALYGPDSHVIRQLLLQMGRWVLAQVDQSSWKLPKDHQTVFNLNTCASNPLSVALVESLGFNCVSGRIRMWRGGVPQSDLSGIYSTGSFTVG